MLFKVTKTDAKIKEKSKEVYYSLNESLNKVVETRFNDLSYRSDNQLKNGLKLYETFCGELVNTKADLSNTILPVKQVTEIIVNIGNDTVCFNVNKMGCLTESGLVDLSMCAICRLIDRYKNSKLNISNSHVLSQFKSNIYPILTGATFSAKAKVLTVNISIES